MAGKIAIGESNVPALAAELKRLGFTEYEARVYVQLLRQPDATAYEIAKSTGVPRPNTYHALEALAHRGAVLPISENPVRYVAADPKTFFDGVARQTEALCTKLGVELSVLKQVEDDQYVWTLRGEQAVHDKIDGLISRAEKNIWVKAADDVLRRHKDALRAAAKRGASSLIVLFGQDAEEFRFNKRCRVYLHEANGARMGSADNLFTVAVDYEEMLTAAIDGDVFAAYTRNKPIVNMAQSLIRHDYYMAEIFARFGPKIDKEFGAYLRDLRLACFSPEEIATFKRKTGMD
mgnify:CR=1 FL=1